MRYANTYIRSFYFYRMKQLLLLLLLPLGIQAQSLKAEAEWYTSLSPDSFFNTPAAQQLIDIENPDLELVDMALFFATNEQRIKRKLAPLVFAAPLREAAAYHSVEMRDKNFFSHINKADKELREPHQRIAAKGGEFSATGENILEMTPYKLRPDEQYDPVKNPDGSFTFMNLRGKPLKIYTYGEFAKAAVKLWMGSPEHKENILSKNFTHLGCGTSFDAEPFKFKALPLTLATQNFGQQ